MAVLKVIVYQADGMTPITEVPYRKGVTCQEPLNTTGTGSITVALPNEVLNAYPGLFAWKNIVKFWYGSKCIHGFRIQNRRTVWVDDGEYSGFVKEISGPSLQILLSDFIVKHDGKPRPDSTDQRSYSWASLRDEWYVPSQWNAPIATRPWTNPPGDWKKPLHKRSKYKQPRGWRDKTARWMYVPRTYPGRRGAKFYRKNFFLKHAQHVRIFASADERLRVYMDGEEVITADNVETGYTQKNNVDLMLGRGTHTIAIYANSIYSSHGDYNDSVIFTMMKVNSRGRAKGVILHSDASWEAHYKNPAPGWNRAQVLRNCVREAKARNNSSADMLSLGFTEHLDSENLRWHDRWNEDVSIGSTGLDLVASLSEGGHFDVWVNPENLQIQAFRRRGRNKSKSVALEPGVNLLSWEVAEADDVKNDFLLQYEGGWTSWRDRKSTRTYGDREAYISLGNIKQAKEAQNLMRRVAQGISSAIQRAGTSDLRTIKEDTPDGGLIAVSGRRPFLDFGVGDVVQAPNSQGTMVPHRVLSLSLTEDDDGNLTFDPELEEVR